MTVRKHHTVRPCGPEDLEFMWEMLYEAAHYRPLSDPHISRYLRGWGRKGDAGVISLDPDDGSKRGAAWDRLMPVEDPGYGFVDASTPEVVIAVVPDQRGTGMGGALLRGLLDTARSQGFDALGLSVREDNHVAIRLYERSGFLKLSSGEGSWTIKADLADPGGE